MALAAGRRGSSEPANQAARVSARVAVVELKPEAPGLRGAAVEPVARAAARKHMSVYLGLPNYQNCLRQFGYGDEDFADNGSDRLVDAIVAWGDEDALRARIQAHWQAGASHVCIQPLPVSGEAGQDMKVLELLAPVND